MDKINSALPLCFLAALLSFSPGLAAQDSDAVKEKLKAAKEAFEAKDYKGGLKLATEAYQNATDGMDQPGSLQAEGLLLIANCYAAQGDFSTAALTFKILNLKSKNPVDKAVGREGERLMNLVAALKKE